MKRLIAMDHLYPAPQDGEPGEDAVVYSIVCSNTNPNVTNNSVDVTLWAYMTRGSERTLINLKNGDYQLNLIIEDGVLGIAEIPYTHTISKGDTTPIVVELINPSQTLDTLTISPVINGVDGTSVLAQYCPSSSEVISIGGTSTKPDESNIHDSYKDGDEWMRTKSSNDAAYGSWFRIVGEKGDGGAWTDYRFNISSALTTSSPQTAPTPLGRSSWEDAPMATTSSFPYLWMQVQKYSDTDTIDGKATYVRLTGQEGQNGESFSRIVDEYQALAKQDPSLLDSTAWKSDVSATSYSADYPYLYKRETVYALDKAGAEYAKSRTVPHLSAVWGTAGRIGPIGYPAGIWDSTTKYTSSDDATPIVYHNKSYWYKVSTTDSTNEEPTADSTVWKLAPKFSVVMVEILMATFGKIASAVFSGDFMMSQYGLNSKDELTNDYEGFDGDPTPYIGNGFAPNICFDMLNGEAWLNKAHIRGEVDAGSINVEYKYLTASDATVVSTKEYTLNNDLNINVDVSGAVVINLPTSKTYVGKHVYIMSYTGPYTRVLDWSVVVASATGIFASGSSDLTNINGGYKSITYVGGVIHLMGMPNAKGCIWGIMSVAVNSINYNK